MYCQSRSHEWRAQFRLIRLFQLRLLFQLTPPTSQFHKGQTTAWKCPCSFDICQTSKERKKKKKKRERHRHSLRPVRVSHSHLPLITLIIPFNTSSCSASLPHSTPFHLPMSWSNAALLQNTTEILLSTHPLSPLLPNLTLLTVPPSTQFSVILNDTLPDGGGNAGYDPNTHLFLGICVSLGTSFVQSLGLAIQRKSYVLNENIHPKELRRNACQQPLWHVGFYTYLISNIIGSVFSIGYLPIVILAPIGAMGLVFNALFARILLGDAFTRQSVIGMYSKIMY